MPAPEEETVQHRRGFTACSMCGREMRQPLIVINGHVYCPEHARELKRRRHEGVSTAELDTAWGDTLKNWSERPPELDRETKPRFLATSFALQEKDEPWLIFSRFYPEFERPRRSKPEATLRAKKTFRTRKGRGSPSRPRHRLPDCIAVNAQTGEIRRFVDVSGNEVLDDLQGIHPAPAQAELASYWGKRKPTGIRERAREQFQRQYLDERHRIRIPDLVHLLPFPIYGPVGNPLDLTLCCSLSMRLGINYISSLGLIFSSPRYPHGRENFEIVASDTRERNIMYSTKNTPGPGDSAFDPDSELFQRYSLSEEERELAGKPSSWEGELIIAGVPFTGELYYWSQPTQLSRFFLKSEKTILTGNAYGPSEDELFGLLKDLQIINQQDDVLLHYQREYDEDEQRLWSRFGS
ncbi:MAG TPA: hypothetical protein VF043_16520 [Ktedonobacteraceae bacterium]